MDCLSGLTVSLKKKEQAHRESQEKFDEQISEPFKQLQDSQRRHIQSIGEEEQHIKSNINRQWKLLKRTLKSERSPWASRYEFDPKVGALISYTGRVSCKRSTFRTSIKGC